MPSGGTLSSGLRYESHLLLKDIGGSGQKKLAAAKVLVIGAGGLGAPLLLYLAAAGVGEITIMDDDRVALANLQRQIIYREDDIGAGKAEAARAALYRRNSSLTINAYAARLDKSTINGLLAPYDIIADGTDNFASRFLLADACWAAEKPLASAAVEGWTGQLTLWMPYARSADGALLPSYRCFIRQPPEEDLLACQRFGVAGPLCGMLGALQALEIVKHLTGAGETLAGRLLLYDGLAARMRIIQLKRDPASPLTSPFVQAKSAAKAARTSSPKAVSWR